ncbi:hypothetical protein BDA96_06G158200 [Sorghum bicolor]|uniref:Ubiquitin-like protease family profile domain-containing protein n=1 Tax=Sorghum bicolor TaxID=4558 RepID=A0A921UCL7_SORBI|nr:hypothetical protein BDA96_06G158200 [Sorghum bicolor]
MARLFLSLRRLFTWYLTFHLVDLLFLPAGKLSLLSRFGKDNVPPISFFSEALVSKKEMSDDDMFVCFIVVAMSTFLCPNSSVVSCHKFFGIFEDLDKIRSYDWCGYILSWLIEYIKLFNQFKSCRSTQQTTLGGCLYFLVVLYLDHVDFGSHQVASTIPRISSIDDEIFTKLDSYARCKLPLELKDAIRKLIEKHYLNCGLSVNFDVNSITALSDEMRLTFIKLWKHVYSVSEMSQVLVLEVIRLLSESVSPEVRIVGAKSFSTCVGEVTKKTNDIYNSKLDLGGSSSTPSQPLTRSTHLSLPSYARLSHSFAPKSQVVSTGGKVPLHGPRRLLNPGPLFRGDYETFKSKFYQVSCIFIFSNFCLFWMSYILVKKFCVSIVAVSLSGVRCTFWSLGESLKPGGFVNTFVVSCFCYSLFSKPNGHPDFSKRHYFFSNIGDNLLLDYDKADQELLQRSFRRSANARPLHQSNMLFFPILHEKHWFVFMVDIKDRHFVFLDSLYSRNSEFHQDIDARLINSFQYHWNKFVQVEMDFNFYGLEYPLVPEQPFDNSSDSGIYAMMFLEYWTSPRVLLGNMFSQEDIPSIRVKIANELFFHHKNTGMKHRVLDFKLQE